jgi:hypothetical protein
MVDAEGTLYYIVHSFNNGFAWYRFVVGKITPSGSQSTYEFPLNVSCMGAYSLWKNNIGSETNQYGNVAWATMMPCIAQEINGTSEYFHAITCVPPSRWWNNHSSPGPDEEGIMLTKIKKSDLSVAETKFCQEDLVDRLGNYTSLIYNRNCFCAYYDAAGPHTVIFYLCKANNSATLFDLKTLFTGLGSFQGVTVSGGA